MGRKDAKLVKKLDSMHLIMPLIYPGRCDNEAFISVTADLTEMNKYLAEKNKENPEFKYTIFHCIVTAMLKTIRLRPKMNWFIANKRVYERNDITASFIVKKVLADNGGEALAFVRGEDGDNLDAVYEKIKKQVYSARSDRKDGSTAAMDMFSRIPFCLLRLAVGFVRILDRHGHVPKSLISSDPYYCSVVLSNLGSIKLKSGYHHLTNWGSNSIIVLIGERKMRPVFKEDGTFEMKDTVELGITIDERLADGYYYSKCVRLIKKLIENPRLLELPLEESIEY